MHAGELWIWSTQTGIISYYYQAYFIFIFILIIFIIKGKLSGIDLIEFSNLIGTVASFWNILSICWLVGWTVSRPDRLLVCQKYFN